VGDTLKREFSLDPVDTGRTTGGGGMPGAPPTGATPPFVPGQPMPTGGSGAPVTRPSFISAFLANLGPALAGGLHSQPGMPFGTGLSGSLQGIEEQKRYNQALEQQRLEFQMRQATEQRAAQSAASTQALQAEETSRMKQLTPLEVKQKQLEQDLMQGQIKFFGDPTNLQAAADDATASLGPLEAAEKSQMNAAMRQAQLTHSFEPVNAAVKTISQDRLLTARKEDLPGLKDYLADSTLDPKIKNKNAATYRAWLSKQTPAAMFMGNMLPSGTALDQQAEAYYQSRELPAGFARSPGTTAAIIKRAAELHPEASLALNKALYKADTQSLAGLQKQFDAVTAFGKTAKLNLQQVLETGAKVPDLGTRFANIPVRNINEKMLGTEAMAKFRTALLTGRTETMRVLSSANAAGALTNEARHEGQEILDGNMPFPAMKASIEQLLTDMGNRHTSYQGQIEEIKKRLAGGKPSATEAEPMEITLPSGKKVTIK